jgi:hypothetical protein
MNNADYGVILEYHYNSQDEQLLGPILHILEKEIGGVRKPYGAKFGAIDLVTVLEFIIGIGITATLGKVVESYFAGLLRTEDAKKIGEQHRENIKRWKANCHRTFKTGHSWTFQKRPFSGR